MPRPAVLRLPSSGAWRIGVVVLSAAAGMPAATRAQAVSADPVPVPGTPAEAGGTPAVPTAPGAKLDKVEITGGRVDDVQERRQSTAAKIIIGRDEIERFGDS